MTTELKHPAGEKSKKYSKWIWGISIVVIVLGIIFIARFNRVSDDLNSFRERSLDARRRADLSTIKVQLEMYAMDHEEKYPTSIVDLPTKYLENIPLDPGTGVPYRYESDKDQKGYKICAILSTGEECQSSPNWK
jgi:hypothetical protein